ncbi:MAG: hypothetical protein E7D78_09300 [Prevotella bivia]|nr:hypothetical protein [Prevotella bivia]
MKHCRIKKGKETRSFPSRNPFTLYSFLFYWLSERYKFIESFAGIVRGDEHLRLFFRFRKRQPAQQGGIARLGELHQFLYEVLLFRRGRYMVQYLVLGRTVNAHILRRAVVRDFRIKVMGVNVID